MNNIYVLILAIFLFHTFWGCTSTTGNKKVTSNARENYYQEKYRPQYHFSPEFGWMNDPNGMVYYKGEYHLFYQYYPDSTVWGPMHWGHAVSTDLVHWEHLPIALYPDSNGYIFSGSAVVDWKNTSGFGTSENPPLVAVFTYHNMKKAKEGRVDAENQGIAYSTNKGRTWIKYKGNPVLLNPGIKDFRDPKVFWHKEARQWNMILSAHDHVELYSSPDLKNWKHESSFGANAGAHGGVWECPDMFPLKTNSTEGVKWVMIVNLNPGGPNGGSGTQYFVGSFDGHNFVPESTQTCWLDWGHDNYAGVTWSDIPGKDGRRLLIGWMSNWDYAQVVPASTWRSAMTVPREITLDKKNGHYKVLVNPVKELRKLRVPKAEINLSDLSVSSKKLIKTAPLRLACSEITVQFQSEDKLPGAFGLILSNGQNEQLKIGCSSAENKLFVDRSKAGKNEFSPKFEGLATAPCKVDNSIKLHIYIDVASIEIFVDNGEMVMSETYFPSSEMDKLHLFSDGGKIEVDNINIRGLKSVWQKHGSN